MKNRKSLFVIITLFFSVILLAQVPRTMNYQAKLTTTDGVALHGMDTIAFKIYNVSEEGTVIWSETLSVTITNGLFDVQLGNIHPINLDFSEPYWMELSISTDAGVSWETFSPREKFTTVSYAYHAIYSDTAEYVTGGIMGDNFIWNQDTSVQDGNAWVSGVGAWGIIRAIPTTPDTFTPQVGMIRTVGTDADYGVYTYDGVCWRKIYYPADNTTCYGGAFSVDAGDDTTIYWGTSAYLTATVSGGWSPYEYDWDNDGAGDWDDTQSITVWPVDTTVYHVQVRDATSAIASDSVTVNVISSQPFAHAIGEASYTQYGRSISQTSDNGYVIGGYGPGFGIPGAIDMILAKLDDTGSLQWTRNIAASEASDISEYCYSVNQTYDNGYIMGGYAYFGGWGQGLHEFYIVKLNAAGSLDWAKSLGGSEEDYGYSVTQTSDSGYVLAGYTGSFGAGAGDILLVKFSKNGTYEWSRAIGGTEQEYGYSVIQTSDNGYALAGHTYSYDAGGGDFFLVKLNSAGTLEWARAIGGTGGESAKAVIQTTDDGYAIAGYTLGYGEGSYDVFLAKFNSTGTMEWARTIGQTGADNAYSVMQTSDGGYTIAGYTNSFGGGGDDLYIVKLSSAGVLEWAGAVGGTSVDKGYSHVSASDGGFVVAGETFCFGAGSYDYFVVKFSSSGVSCIGSTDTPVVNSVFPTVTNVTPTVSTVSPTVTSRTPTVTSPSPTDTDCCE